MRETRLQSSLSPPLTILPVEDFWGKGGTLYVFVKKQIPPSSQGSGTIWERVERLKGQG